MAYKILLLPMACIFLFISRAFSMFCFSNNYQQTGFLQGIDEASFPPVRLIIFLTVRDEDVVLVSGDDASHEQV